MIFCECVGGGGLISKICLGNLEAASCTGVTQMSQQSLPTRTIPQD